MLAWRDVDIPLNPQEGHRGYQIVDGGKDRKRKAAPQRGGSGSLVVAPHGQDLHGLLCWIDLVHNAVLNVDAAGVKTG